MGAIVHNGTGTTLSVSGSYRFASIDLDGAGGADWGLFIASYNAAAFGSHSNGDAGATVATGTSAAAAAIKLASGFIVGPTLASGAFTAEAAVWYY